jgi:hypothetical protein
MRALEFWEEVFSDMESLDRYSVFCFLWDRISAFPFRRSESDQILRLSLIRRLLTLMEGESDLYVPPDLCRGFLLLETGDYVAAANELRILVDLYPANGRLHAYLADALFLQGKGESAGVAYAVSLLQAPHDVPVASLRNSRLINIIREHGAALAPIYGYLEGVLPLVSLHSWPASDEARAYSLLMQAEQALRLDKYDEMVAARRGLKKLAPAILQDYLAWLES